MFWIDRINYDRKDIVKIAWDVTLFTRVFSKDERVVFNDLFGYTYNCACLTKYT